ncbi:hypothetical protein LCGC14_1223980 [marine sediment metagenome]|uniref:Uncharacterized protein n=1 Tax=marine sediment metagenome TaxID=412755 RepID=A0A0F9NSS6_9ZZZZ
MRKLLVLLFIVVLFAAIHFSIAPAEYMSSPPPRSGGLPLTVSGYTITFNYDTDDFTLDGNNLQLVGGAGDVTGVDAGDAIRVDDPATATPEVNIDFDENTTDLEGTVLEPDDVILVMDTSNADDMARHSVSDIALEDLSVNSAGVYGFNGAGVFTYASAIPDDAAEPGFIGYDTGGLGADKADGYTGKAGWQMSDGTEDAEYSDRFVSFMLNGTERNYIFWDASDEAFYLGTMTRGDTPADVAGSEYLKIDLNTGVDGQAEISGGGTTTILLTGMTFDATGPHLATTSDVVTVSGNTGVYYNADNDVQEYDLPAAANGKTFCFNSDTFAQVITIDPDDSDTITLVGVTDSVGDAIVSSGAVGESICLHGLSDSRWVAWGPVGTWAAE